MTTCAFCGCETDEARFCSMICFVAFMQYVNRLESAARRGAPVARGEA